jgi:tRNA(adenine34) deaminase
MMESDEYYMNLALSIAQQAWRVHQEVPVGCVLVKDSEVLALTHNLRESRQDPTSHAELLAIQEASQKLKNWRLVGTRLYITLEPCLMCAGAIILARIPHVIFGAFDPKAGVAGSLLNAFELPVNHQVKLQGGILQRECGQLLSSFFQEKRKQKKNIF